MDKVTQIFAQPHVFSLSEATKLLPVICRITAEASRSVQRLVDCLDAMDCDGEDLVQATEDEINRQIQSWQTKVEKLGAHPKGLWVVDFDFGRGYYCWKFPEKEILYWRGPSQSFSQRTRIQTSEHPIVEEKSR